MAGLLPSYLNCPVTVSVTPYFPTSEQGDLGLNLPLTSLEPWVSYLNSPKGGDNASCG